MIEYSPTLQKLIKDYYTDLYRSVGLNDVEQRVQARLAEEDFEAKRSIETERLINCRFGNGQKHLVVGAGTGGLAVMLFGKKCEVYGIEPDLRAHAIIQAKAAATGMPAERFLAAKAEEMPFQDNFFDFIHCFTVLEHVGNVPRALSEMIRVLKPGGYLYINSPDYRFWYERHYKIFFPTFLPKIFGYLYLWLLGKPVRFFRSIKYLTEHKINRILYHHPVVWQRVYRQIPSSLSGYRFWPFLWKFLTLGRNIPLNQEILIRKKEGNF